RSGASLSQSRPWTSSVASVRSVMSSGGADWSDWPRDGVIGPLTPMEPINHRTDWRANAMVSKVRKSCTEYKGAKREDNLQAFQGLWSSMSFRRPRGVDVIHAAAVAARKPRPQPARGFTERGGPGPAAARRTPYDIAKECPFLQKLEDQLQGFVQMLVEEDGLSFLSEVAGQVLYREKDMLFNAYILLAGSVQQFSNDYDFLNSVGWRGHAEQTDKAEEERPERPKRLHRQPTMRSTQRTAEQHLSMPTLTEHVRQVGRREEDQEMRFRTVEGQSDFTQAVLLDGRLFATCAGFLADSYDLFTIDLVVLILQIQYGEELISTGAKSLMVSTMLLGVVCGQLFFGSLSDWLGRKWAFVATALLTVLSALAGALCVDGAWRLPQQLALCRFLLGFGVGGEYPLSATVSAESVDDAQGRGRVMALVLSMQGFGMMLAALLAMALAKTASLEATWRLLLAFGALPSAVAFGLRWQLQESEVFIKSKAVEGDHGRRVLETLADYWPRLVGTAGAWMLLNVFTYSLGSFKSSIFEPGLGAASADDAPLPAGYRKGGRNGKPADFLRLFRLCPAR
ncbi:unnamed protein product, partial [Effrenium voratum]